MDLNLENKINLSENAIKVLEKRYLKRDINGEPIEKPEDLFYRVAKTIALADKSYGICDNEIEKLTQDFYNFMSDLSFMPNSPTLMNAGRELGQLSACFVLPIEDSLEGIFDTIKNTALIHKSGGGTGFSFSRLRPKNDVVKSTMGVSSGPVSFMEVFNAATEAVKQGGTRRGANMGILRVDHPDILEFIDCKSDGSVLNNFNISVAITDKFMEALKTNSDYDLIHPKDKKVVKTLNSKYVFDLIVEHAHKNGEPGIVFIDRINADNPTPQIGEIESTNPCGEVPLLPFEACNLGSINLSGMVEKQNGISVINWNKLKYVTQLSIHFLDNVITVNNYPLPQISKMVRDNRKIGLGVMGFADLLMKLNISYCSQEGITLGSQIMEFINYHSKVKSVELSKKRGRFNNFTNSIYDNKNYLYNKYKGISSDIIGEDKWRDLDKEIEKFGIRNATTTCIAPTGTISMIANCSGGIEPLFSLVFMRKIMDGTQLFEANDNFKNFAKKNGFYSEDLMKQIFKEGTIKHIDCVPNKAKEIFATAHDVSPYWHVKMQSAFQQHTDNAVSKTINFEENATKDDIKEAYILAFNENLKGITVYRNNSRTLQPMNLEKSASKDKSVEDDVKVEIVNSNVKLKTCPECGYSIEMAEGCFICLNCGYSGCS